MTDDLCDRCLHPRSIHPPDGGTWDGRCAGFTLHWPDDRCYCAEFFPEVDADA